LAKSLSKIGINAMTDVSDGIGTEIKNICAASGVGAIIYADKIPISTSTREDAKELGKNPLDFALYGGEDFELVFTASKDRIKELEKLDVTAIGEIVEKNKGIKLRINGKDLELKPGFDHFTRK